LENLNASENKLTEIPIWFYRLREMKTIFMQKNEIEQICTSLCHLKKLEILNLAQNRIEELPITLGYLSTNLKELNVEDNGFLSFFPPEILEEINNPANHTNITKKTKILLEYFNEQLNQVEPANRIKAMIIGKENTGKTTLLETLVKKWSEESADNRGSAVHSTDGLEISTSFF